MHSTIADIAGNSWAQRLHTQVASQMERYRRFTNNSDARRHAALDEHRAITELIANGDVDAAGRAARAHAIGARDGAVRTIGADLD